MFAAETVVVIVDPARAQADARGAAARRTRRSSTSSAWRSRRPGLGLIVFGILRSSVWGFVQPRDAPTINGTEITPLGFSLVPFLILGRPRAALARSALWEERRERLGQDPLLDRTLLRHRARCAPASRR